MKPELELYLHIPFCVQKCAYCDFLSGPADRITCNKYVHAVKKEIQGYKGEYREKYIITTIFIGGGTPSLLEAEEIAEIFDALHQSFQIALDAEITIEVNPGTVTVGKLKAWKEAGINRLSIGLQSANDEELKMLGRIHDFGTFHETYRLAREAGFSNINIDLISAIPGQTKESWKNTLVEIAKLSPEHISAYSLIIEKGTPFYDIYGETEPQKVMARGQNTDSVLKALPDEDEERAIYEMTADILKGYGYRRYEISNYSKEGFACRHNIGYWERKEYLGIGLGASSLLDHARFHNTADFETYISNIQSGASVKEGIEQLSLAEEIEEFMFLGLRETEGISAASFRKAFGKELFTVYGEQLEKLGSAGLLKIEEDNICLTKRGVDISNAVFVEFLDPPV